MINSAEELIDLLSKTSLDDRPVATLPVLNTDESALVIDILPAEIDTAWSALRGLIDETGRWPIVSSAWGSTSGILEKRLAEEDPFSRFYYKEAPGADDVSPRGLIEKSRLVCPDEFVAQLDANSAKEMDDGWAAEWLEEELDKCMTTIGRLPEQDELDHSIVHPVIRVDRWIFDQLLASGKPPEYQVRQFEWYQPSNAHLILLPVTSSWEALAYCHFFGAYEGSEYYIAVGKRWEEKYGAELVCHYGTMLQCRVQNPPRDPAEAWQLAREHDLLSSNTLASTGTSIRDYARGLTGMTRWFLHDRP